jgi:hypothetical protein
MQQDLAVLAEETHVPGAGVQVDATRKLVLLGVASPGVASASVGRLPNASSPTG